jgi:uncharacterized linocin/CFP29 family protein
MADILQFTPEQEAQVWAARNSFNDRQTAMSTNGALEGNALSIPIDAWRRIDGRAQQLARSRLVVFNALAAASTQPVSIADLVSYYPQVSDSGEVTVTMDGRNQAKADQAAVKYVGTPVPVMTSTARMGWRQMEVMRKGGGMLDVTTIANNQRKVAEKLEDMVINGLSSVSVGGDTVYGLRNFPQRNALTHGLTLSTATGAQWLTAVKAIINSAIGDNQFGRITLFVNIGDYVAIDTTDYSASYSGTIKERLMTIGQIADIVPSSSIPASEIIGIVDLAAGEWGSILSAMPMTTRPKTRQEPEDDYVFSVIAAAAPQFRADYNGNSPFVHSTTA